MRHHSLSLTDLKEYVKKIPDHVDSPSDYHRVSIPCRVSQSYHDYCYTQHRGHHVPHINTIEFRAERTTVNGARALAWYYHDLLVKVSV